MHLDHDHIAHEHPHTHEHTHDGVTHTHEHTHDGVTHTHEHTHEHPHDHSHGCAQGCSSCGTPCEHTPMEELLALMNYMIGHNAAHANELANLAKQLDEAGEHTAYEQVMTAVSDFEKGNMRLTTVLASLKK